VSYGDGMSDEQSPQTREADDSSSEPKPAEREQESSTAEGAMVAESDEADPELLEESAYSNGESSD
jgi:hypothetical protein